MLHGSAVAGIVTILDLTGAARLVNARYYAPFEAFLTAGLFYMCLTFTMLWCFKQAEKEHYGFRPKSNDLKAGSRSSINISSVFCTSVCIEEKR